MKEIDLLEKSITIDLQMIIQDVKNKSTKQWLIRFIQW